ncbi:MAG: DegT/DnrJ/EryC1/StrS family aminotransferase [Chlamydiales bacterium]|nr:DegT/DnrJ/EryC1/StrS family aminotransferase [Chlamydiales bacterium]
MEIPVYQPYLTEIEKKYLNECLDSNWISSKGRFISLFEESFASFIDAQFAATVSNGTVALHVALRALDIKEGDEVLVPTLTYVASANAVKYCQALPVFVDSCPETWQMDPKDLVDKITPRTKAVMPVHLYGYPCDMEAICAIAKQHNLLIIEDCAEAFGTFYRGKHVGNFGDIATFSFFGNKTISCGEGGMVVTNSAEIDEKVRCLKGQELAKGKEYFHDILGYNYRLTNVQAAIGLGQMKQAEAILQAKRRIADHYRERLPLSYQKDKEGMINSYWMCSFLAEDVQQKNEIRRYLREHGVETRPFFTPIHLMPYYSGREGDYPVAEALAEAGFSLPSWPGLTKEQLDSICSLVEDVVACKKF